MKFFIHLAYNGANYRGWQRQPNAPSVQAVLEDAIEKMLSKKIHCIGCGRTDAGVHARQFFCHIVLTRPLDFDPVFRLNKMTPDDIAIYEFIRVPEQAQAQFDVLERTYEYAIHGRKNPFLSPFSTHYLMEEWDFEKMEKAADQLIGEQNFRSFCKQPDVYKNTFCKVSGARFTISANGDRLRFQITAARFLRGMVRLIVGNLIEIGKGNLSIRAFENALHKQTPLPYFKMAYPQGLCLSKVRYNYIEGHEELINRSLSIV